MTLIILTPATPEQIQQQNRSLEIRDPVIREKLETIVRYLLERD